ncbi:MAG: glycoside hydrolase family 3 C-terminal domain-containing protein [Lachnospiraceae bacterium]|nr:glycoside hydrolase family 3 C-terminal domain-containing protein [Lachnospiraceae bacterium]
MKYKATTDPKETERERNHNELVRKIAPEGIVLLKNDGVLPIEDCKKIALYGAGIRHTIKGGTGSGDVNTRNTVNIEQGFENAGVEVVTKAWLDAYDKKNEKAIEEYINEKKALLATGKNFIDVMLSKGFKSPIHDVISAKEASKYKADIAMYVISRNSGEGTDRDNEENDYLLAGNEIESIENLVKVYDKVIVALNIGGAVETEKLMAVDGAQSIILISQPGNFVGNIVADVILGKTYPSGKLTTTWASNYSQYPFGDEFSHMDGNLDDSYYKEGIYVGYRYFETFNIKPAFCFGYGLSYTTFELEYRGISNDKTKVKCRALVKNTGKKYPGKEVVQLYLGKPNGKLEQPKKILAGFTKTQELAPGDKEIVDIVFDLSDFSSFDEKSASYILEKGNYKVFLGNSVMSARVVATINLDDDVTVMKAKNLLKQIEPFEELKQNDPADMADEDSDISDDNMIKMSHAWFKTVEPDYGKEIFIPQEAKAEGSKDNGTMSYEYSLDDVKKGDITLEQFVTGLSVDELIYLCNGTGWDVEKKEDESIIGNAAKKVPGAAGEITARLKDKGVDNLVMADGPAGLRLVEKFGVDKEGNLVEAGLAIPFMNEILGIEPAPSDKVDKYYYQYCTAIPIATMLAQSWNMEAIKELGYMIGDEMAEFGINYWLAPGMNIHRNVLCGRNFEYYSEDPLIAGKCAAAMTLGVQSHKGATTTIKHFAMNNQEDNRLLSNSNASERTIREIYLKAFEICVRESKPKSIMTSYNLINGVHTAANRELIKDILRSEWGFDGMVMSDWGTTGFAIMMEDTSKRDTRYNYSDPIECIKAGNDIIMPGFEKDLDRIRKAVEEGCLDINDLRYCAKNVLASNIYLTE